MKVNVWGINYAPELTGIGVYNTGMCEYLSAQGDSVTMVTGFPYYPQWKLLEKGLYRTDIVNEVTVERCGLYVPSQPTPLKRIIHEATFAASSFLKQLTLPAADVYVVVSPPLLLGFAAWLLCLIKGRSFVFHVQDMQPDAAYGLSMLKNELLMKMLYWLEKFSYDKARLVTAISPQMCGLIANKGISENKIALFPNWVEGSVGQVSVSFKGRHGIGDNVSLVTYAGNLGMKQGISVIAEVAQLLSGKPIQFVIAGNGAEAGRLRQVKQENKLDNLLLLDVLPEEAHTSLLIESDICLIPQKKGAGTAFLPSKLLKILALGRPVIAIAEESGALAPALVEGGFGIRVEPDQPSKLANAVSDLLADLNKRTQMSKSGIAYVQQFAASKVLSDFRTRLMAVGRQK